MKLSINQEKVTRSITFLQKYTHKIWYIPFIALLAALDNFVILIPTDPILVASSLLSPKRWLAFAFTISIGSTIGAISLILLVKYQGLQLITNFYPGLVETGIWTTASNLLDTYGLLLIFAVSIIPFMQLPVIVLSGLANISLVPLFILIYLGRTIRFVILSYLGSKAQYLLKKII